MFVRPLAALLILAMIGIPVGFAEATSDQADFYPLLVRSELPLYPGPARYMRISGAVVIQVKVEKGLVTDAQVKSSDNKILSDWATANVKTWQFFPYEEATFPITYVYRLNRKPYKNDRENLRVEFEFPHTVTIFASPLNGSCNDCGTNR